MRIILLLILTNVFILGAGIEDIDKNIDANKSKLQEKNKEKIQISNLLNTLGATINQKRDEIRTLNTQITNVQNSIDKNQFESSEQEKLLQGYRKSLFTLKKEKNKIQNDLSNILIKDMAFVILLNQKNPISPDDIILQEIFKSINKEAKNIIAKLGEKEGSINIQIAQVTDSINKISSFIDSQKGRKQRFQEMILKQRKLVDTLNTELESYNKRLKEIDNERKSLDNILSNLNILKQNKEKELLTKQEPKQQPRKDQDKRKNINQNVSNLYNNDFQAPLDVRQLASTYRNVSTTKYRGSKTISPLSHYEVEQKFGTYFDPVYKLKVFNESVILASKTPNALVRNIFDGKVVYAKEVPILKKVIIIEHSNQMHTIYSHLDKIAPTIKPGLRIKKGYVIGRIENKLGFEVTQKDRHIDPLDIILRSK